MPDDDYRPRYGAQTKARKAALDILFASDQRNRGFLETLEELRQVGDVPLREFTVTLVEGVANHLAAIDDRISTCLSERWTLTRMPAVDRNLARIATFEIDYTNVPDATAIAEAVRLGGDLSTDSSPGFLNGVLKSVAAGKQAPEET